jgi:hypothetical protein
MFPTSTDLAFYRQKTTPKWARSLRSSYAPCSVDDVVNSHVDKSNGSRRIHKGPEALLGLLPLTLSNLKNAQEPHAISDGLRKLSSCSMRGASAKRWLRRLAHSKIYAP